MGRIIDKTKKIVIKAKEKTSIYLKTNVLFSTFVITSVINGILIRYFTIKNLAIGPILADTAVIALVGSIGYLIKPKKQFWYFFVWTILLSTICFINSLYYRNYVAFASFSVIKTSLQLVDMGGGPVVNILEAYDFIYFYQIIVMIIVNHLLKKHNYYEIVGSTENGKKSALHTSITSIALAAVFVFTVNFVDLGRLVNQWNREFVVMKFGIYTYQFNDLIASIQPTISPLFGYDSKAKEFREYYENKKTNDISNEYTDIYKGKNILLIHAESIQNFLLNDTINGKEITPNLNRLSKEGLYFSNFYAQESIGTSSDTEFTISTSLMPASKGTVFVSYYDRDYPSVQKILKKQNYYTFSMHGNKGSFWNRNIMYQSLGYDDFYYYDKDFVIDDTLGFGLSDKSFFKQTVPKIKEISETHDNFYGTLIMLTNHTPFSFIDEVSDFEVDYKYQTKINGKITTKSASYLEGTLMGSYIKCVHYADEAIGQLMDDLDSAGILENIVVVIYGDHDAKLKVKEYERYYNYNYLTDSILDENDDNYIDVDGYNHELLRNVPLIIWTKDNQQKKEVTEVMGMYDVLPTLGNMFGFENEYALGHDIFSVEENVVVFPNGNWLTNKMYYNSQKEEGMLLKSNETVSGDYIDKYSKIAQEAVSVSNGIIVYDLIKSEKELEILRGN